MKAVSEIVGRAEVAGGRSAEVYRALRPLLCATCGAEIGEGTLFTRRKVKGIGVRIMPQCPKCRPFALKGDGKKQSDLLRTLLAGQPSDSPERAAPEGISQPHDASKNLKEEAARRLGPALRRSKKGRQ